MSTTEPMKALEAPHGEGPLSFYLPRLARLALIWLLFIVVIPQAIDFLPAPVWFDVFVTERVNPTEIIEYLLSVGLTIIALTATTLAVVWQLTIQKYSGTFLRVLVYRLAIVYSWGWCLLTLSYMLVLWAITYAKTDSAHPSALSFVISTTTCGIAFLAGVIACIVALAKVLADLSPKRLLDRLEVEALNAWDQLNAIATRMDLKPAQEKLLRHQIEWVETLIPNITKIGLGALRDGDFELLRQCVKSQVRIYRRASEQINFKSLNDAIYHHRMQLTKTDLKEQFWPLGFVLHEMRELHAYTLSLRDPGFTDLQHEKLESEWREIASAPGFDQARQWVKFVEEVFLAAQSHSRPVTAIEMVNLALRLYYHLWETIDKDARILTNPELLKQHTTVLVELIRMLCRLLRYSMWAGDVHNVRLIADTLVHVVETNQRACEAFRPTTTRLDKHLVYTELVNNCILALSEKKYECVQELIRRMVFFLDINLVLDRVTIPVWLPEPPLNRGTPVLPLRGGQHPYLYHFKKFVAILLAYASFHSSNGALPKKYVLDDGSFPKWFFAPESQLRTLEQDLTGRSTTWDDMFLGTARQEFESLFEYAWFYCRKR